MDSRGQGSIGLARFVLALIVGAVLWLLFSEVGTPLLDRAANETSNQSANQATAWLRTFAIDLTPIIFILLAMFSVIVAAVYYREVLR